MPNQLDLWPRAPTPPPLRWSYSRGQRLATCPRQYYWYHHGSVAGGGHGAPALVGRARALKRLQSRYALAGEIVHGAVAAALATWERGEICDPAATAQRATRRLEGAVRASRAAHRGATLLEHVYGDPGDAAWTALSARVARAVAGFFVLPVTAELRALPRHRLLARERGGAFALAGATVVVRPDVAWRGPAGQITVLDWKTGAPHPQHRQQLAVYALLAAHLWAGPDTEIVGQLAYLDPPEVVPVALGPAVRAAAEAEVAASVARMRALSPAPGPADIAAFAPTPTPARCGRCAFRAICVAAVDPPSDAVP